MLFGIKDGRSVFLVLRCDMFFIELFFNGLYIRFWFNFLVVLMLMLDELVLIVVLKFILFEFLWCIVDC